MMSFNNARIYTTTSMVASYQLNAVRRPALVSGGGGQSPLPVPLMIIIMNDINPIDYVADTLVDSGGVNKPRPRVRVWATAPFRDSVTTHKISVSNRTYYARVRLVPAVDRIAFRAGGEPVGGVLIQRALGAN
jgi:hypothetical protein